MDKSEKKYYLGLDMGTNSVGWAVTDKEYNILRTRGKDMWGVREFDEAESAVSRRTNRGSRRRYDRRQIKIGLLREYFSDAIEKVDPLFYVRLDNSKYYYTKDDVDKDERLTSKYSIFNDEKYTDKEYYKEYPTIYHLRKELIENNKKSYDVRLVYLAIANMFKHRGHFLLNGVSGEGNSSNMENLYEDLVSILNNEEMNVDFVTGKFSDLVEILTDKSKSRSSKKDDIMELFSVNKKDKKTVEFIKLLCGLTTKAKELFTEIESDEKFDIVFNDYNYEDKISSIEAFVGESNYSIIENFKMLYDYIALENVLKGYEYLSYARVDEYKKHKEDLKILKKVYKKYKTQDDYDKMFRSNEGGTYSAYVNSTNSDDSLAKVGKEIIKKYRRNMSKKRSIDLLYEKIKSDFKNIKDDSDVNYIFDEMEKESFLLKQLTSANGVIPNQVHTKEMKKILKNAEEYLPFLKDKDEIGLTISEKIIQLFQFKIPYYIGPTSTDSKTGWVARKEKGLVLPWNIDNKIDINKTSEEFIKRLIRECTYVSGEKVMPKSSLEYQSFCVLNEINNIKIDNIRIDTSLKQELYINLFQKGKKVTKTQIINYFVAKGLIEKKEQVSGIDININNSLSSYGKMYAIFGDKLNEDKYKTIAEDIIYWGTVYGDSKKMFTEKLREYLNKGYITEENLKRIRGYKFKDWARLSKALLNLTAIDKSSGEKISIKNALWHYSYNFMELINDTDRFTFKEELEKYRANTLKSLEEFEASDLEDFYFSAPVRRMIWQTLSLIKEIVDIMKCPPERIFIEMTRKDEEKGDKGRKNSREKELKEKYKSIKNTEIHDWNKEIKEIAENGKINSKKFYLYYLQNGRDMYTGKEIALEDLAADGMYDIDHIYPRHFVKDDSIHNNLVLVNRKANQDLKKDIYPIPDTIRNNPEVRKLWDSLHKKGFLNDEKYNRLINSNPFSDEQMAGFIKRQLVETSQGTLGVADILKQMLPKTTIVYSKAGNVGEFRRKFSFYKSRIVNEFHHAHDAYFNIVVGNVYYTKFTQNPINFIKKEYDLDKKKNNYNLNKMYDWNVARNGEVAWVKADSNTKGTISTVKKMISKNTPIITRRSYISKGELYNINLIGKYTAKSKNYVPIKTRGNVDMQVEKYGGYASLKPAYFVFFEYGPEKKRKRTFEVVSLYYADKIKSRDDLIIYFENKNKKYKNIKIIYDKIKKGSLIKMNGFYLYLSGYDTNNKVEFQNATSFFVSSKDMEYIHKLEVTDEKIKNGSKAKLDKDICEERNTELYEQLAYVHKTSIHNSSPKPLGDMLEKGIDSFRDLGLEKQIDMLCKIIKVSALGSKSINLKEIGGSTESGRIRISSDMTNKEELLLIMQSTSGLYEKTINLLK